jgi:hypothetical protein
VIRLKEREVVIIGSGDIGLIMARRMSWIGCRVKAVVEILPFPSGLPRNIVQCLRDFDIPLHLGHLTTSIYGRDRVEGIEVTPVIETNSILTLSLSVVAGEVCSVLPGALVGAALGYAELEAHPLISPEVRTPIGFMLTQAERPSRALAAALALAQDPAWLAHAAAHSGALGT